MTIGLFPLVIVAAAAALSGLALSLIPVFRGGRPLSWARILLILVPLAVLDGIACLWFVISAGLSHSAAAITAVPMKCLGATVALVVLPAVVLVVVRRKRAGGPGNPGPPAA